MHDVNAGARGPVTDMNPALCRLTPKMGMLIKLGDALKTGIWEMFDSGHAVSTKELKEAIQKFSQKADEDTLRRIVKIIKVFER